MSDIIRLLPDHVANQIAAGEVIQRPASIVKELMENAIDAGATKITVNITDAGRTLVQVIDNGCGMSETDARMAFERHATSKIHEANDLFAIRTMGFRGEALASIAAVAQVSLKTKKHEEELGTELVIHGSQVISQQPVSCANGSNFSIKNLFYNIPARRKFLKKDTIEFKHIIVEFQRVSLAFPQVEFSLHHNNTEILHLPTANYKQRIVNLFGKNMNQALVSINNETTLAKITGFIGNPEFAKKKASEQYFFVNNRYMKHPYFYKAVQNAFEGLLKPDETPVFFVNFEIDPQSIDINIHPTKTEIKFEDEQSLWQILNAVVKEALGKSNFVPSIDFDTRGKVDIPVINKNSMDPVKQPCIIFNPDYNPFNTGNSPRVDHKTEYYEWAKLFEQQETANTPSKLNVIEEKEPLQKDIAYEEKQVYFFQFKNKYILTPVKSGLMIIDQQRAHQRILYEKFIRSLAMNQGISQQNLFPQTMELSAEDYQCMLDIAPDLQLLGFTISDFGNRSIVINGMPADMEIANAEAFIHELIESFNSTGKEAKENKKDKLACSLAAASAIKPGKQLKPEEMQELFHQLFSCENPAYSPNGKIIVNILSLEEIDKRF